MIADACTHPPRPSRMPNSFLQPRGRELPCRCAVSSGLSHSEIFFSKTIWVLEHLQSADQHAGCRRVYEWESSKLDRTTCQRLLWAVWGLLGRVWASRLLFMGTPLLLNSLKVPLVNA